MPRVVLVKFRLRRRTGDEWATADTVLDAGEQGLELDTGRFKIGDGVKKWSQLRYFVPEGTTSSSALNEHINAAEPHPVYDDIVPLSILFENGLV